MIDRIIWGVVTPIICPQIYYGAVDMVINESVYQNPFLFFYLFSYIGLTKPRQHLVRAISHIAVVIRIIIDGKFREIAGERFIVIHPFAECERASEKEKKIVSLRWIFD